MIRRQKLFRFEIDLTSSAGLVLLMGFFVGFCAGLAGFESGVKRNILPREPASINRAVVVLVRPSKLFGPSGEFLSPELVDAYNQVKASQKPFDATQIIPEGLTPTDNSGLVFSKIADRSASSFFNSAQMRSTPLGQTATSVEKKMKQDVTIEREGVQHKMVFQVQAFQAMAKLDYSGFANATLKYQARESILNLEVYQKVTKTKELVLGQMNKPDDRVSSIHMRWSF